MKRAIKHTSSIYEYLEASGVLDTGTDTQIENARKAYWKEYRAAYQRQKRKEMNVFTVSFTNKEMRLLKPIVKKHNSSYTPFIKQATLAYLQQQFVIMDPESINQIRELLTRNFTTLQNFEEQLPENHTHVSLTKIFSLLEQDINQILHNPNTLENAIQNSIQANPGFRQTILKILES